MADFIIKELEGTRFVEVHMNDETVRLEAGAFSYLQGNVHIHSKVIPSIGVVFRSIMADEAIFRPTYSGSGTITLESSLGGFHVLELDGETWFLNRGAYWASEEGVDVSFHREPFLTSYWAGEGIVYLLTRVRGVGKVVVTTRGPTEPVHLKKGDRLVADGRQVIARTAGVKFSIERPTRNWMGLFTSGEGWVRVYEGAGKVLLNPAPYWRYRVYSERANDASLLLRTTD
ncbi:MAG: AIM24 family protein [Pirellula sp.]